MERKREDVMRREARVVEHLWIKRDLKLSWRGSAERQAQHEPDHPKACRPDRFKKLIAKSVVEDRLKKSTIRSAVEAGRPLEAHISILVNMNIIDI